MIIERGMSMIEVKTVEYTRLDKLKEEKEQINNMKCLSFDLIEKCNEWYDHEIECIEKYGSANPTYTKIVN
jgi:hypothetical protein